MKGLHRLGWFLEIRHSKLHLATYRRLPAVVLFLLTSIGIGITFLTWLDDYFQLNGRIKYPVDISDEGAQKDLDHTLRWSPFLRSLSIRSQRVLDLSQIQHMRRMKLLWISGPMKTRLNLSRLKDLQLLGAGRSMTKVSGLDTLTKLHYVHVDSPTQVWIRSLPQSVKRLFITKNRLERLDLSRFTHLDVLGFASQKHISATDVDLPANLKRLDLIEISTITDFDYWLDCCRKLAKINLDTCPEELVQSVQANAKNRGIEIETG